MGNVIKLFGNDSNDETPETPAQDSSERPSWESVLNAMTNPKSKVHEAIDDEGNITFDN